MWPNENEQNGAIIFEIKKELDKFRFSTRPEHLTIEYHIEYHALMPEVHDRHTQSI